MNSLSTHGVVEQMTNQLAARRRTLIGRREAYVALANAILAGDEPPQRLTPSAGLATEPRLDWDSAGAA